MAAMKRGIRPLVDPAVAVLAGVVAGTVATAVELVLWWLNGVALPQTLFRDARFAAAIVLGRGALAPAGTFDGRVMLVASALHFALSIAYALALAAAIAPLRPRAAIAAGALFGLLLYAVNMYGFTLVFPWFAATRDAVTLTAHIVFGATAAAVCNAARRGSPRNGATA